MVLGCAVRAVRSRAAIWLGAKVVAPTRDAYPHHRRNKSITKYHAAPDDRLVKNEPGRGEEDKAEIGRFLLHYLAHIVAGHSIPRFTAWLAWLAIITEAAQPKKWDRDPADSTSCFVMRPEVVS